MNEGFVPLNLDGNNGSRRLASFVGLNGGNGLGKNGNGSHTRSGKGHALPGHYHEHDASETPQPKVTLHRDGDTITKIEIECPCGGRVELSCDYGEPISVDEPESALFEGERIN